MSASSQETPEKSLEVEVKFLVENLAAVRERLLAAGAALKKTRVFERNIRFDTADDALLKRSELLRLRQDAGARLTFKGPDISDQWSEAKIREELEVGISDFDTAAAIIERLGFQARQVYEKYRETFQMGQLEVVLDELPFGAFVELEGDITSIKQGAVTLGLPWERRILNNYLALMGELKIFHDLPFGDLTFENFSGRDISINDLPLYTAA